MPFYGEEDSVVVAAGPWLPLAFATVPIEHTGTTDPTTKLTVAVGSGLLGTMGELRCRFWVEGDGSDDGEAWQIEVYLGSTLLGAEAGGFEDFKFLWVDLTNAGVANRQLIKVSDAGSNAEDATAAEDTASALNLTVVLTLDNADESVFLTNYLVEYRS